MGHYKPVLAPKYSNITEVYSIVDVVGFIKEEYSEDFEPGGDVVYVAPINENDEGIAVGVFSKDPTYFPLITHLMYGVTISFKGKTYHLSYDENGFLNVGHEGVLYLLENEDFISDCLSIYDIIWDENGMEILKSCISDETEFTY